MQESYDTFLVIQPLVTERITAEKRPRHLFLCLHRTWKLSKSGQIVSNTSNPTTTIVKKSHVRTPPETSSLKSILGYLAKYPTEVVWIPRLHFFTHARSRMPLPPALSICDTFLVDEWTDFCGNCLRYLLFARTHVKLQKCVQKPLRWVKIHENQCPVA